VRLRDYGRNVPIIPVGSVPPGFRPASEVPMPPEVAAAKDHLTEALARREQLLAHHVDENSMRQLEAQSEIEAAELEVRRLKAMAELDALKRDLRPPAPEPEGERAMAFMLGQAEKRESELRATIAQLQNQQFEAQQRQLEAQAKQIEELRHQRTQPATEAKPRGLADSIAEAVNLVRSLEELTGHNSKGATLADMRAEAEMRHNFRMRELEFERERARDQAELALNQQKIQIENQNYAKLADTLDQAAPAFVQMVTHAISGETPKDLPPGSLGGPEPMRVTCAVCHKDFVAAVGWQETDCPHCQTHLYSRPPEEERPTVIDMPPADQQAPQTPPPAQVEEPAVFV
jgi:hypothetical protein